MMLDEVRVYEYWPPENSLMDEKEIFSDKKL